MSQPLSWYKEIIARAAWQGTFDTYEDLARELDWLIEKAINESRRSSV